MITRVTGLLVGLNEFCATIRIGGFDHEVLLPDIVRRQLQSKVDTEVSLRTIEYLEGNPQQGRLTPRMIGFMNEAELEFFESGVFRRWPGRQESAARHGSTCARNRDFD